MGRPLNKKFFGANASNNIKVQFFNGTSSVNGYIVKQKGTRTFLCQEFGAETTALCRLVDKNAADLVAGEMTMTVVTDSGTVDQVTKITAHRITAGGVGYAWNFDASTSDNKVQIEEAGTDAAGTDADDLEPVITISVQPAASSPTAPADGSFSVTATATLSAPLTYQWEVSEDAGVTFTAIDAATASTLTVTSADPEYVTGNEFRVVVTAAGGISETSDSAALTLL